MNAHECIEFLREEHSLALNDSIPLTAEKFKQCADYLEHLWNASQQRADEQEDWLMQRKGNQ